MVSIEFVHPAALSMPAWPAEPESVDASGASFLIISIGGTEAAEVTGSWVREAESMASTTVLVLDDLSGESEHQLRVQLMQARTGVRIMVAGGQYDVLRALAIARSGGAGAAELRSFVTHCDDLPMYCAHCRDTYRVEASPGGTVNCPGCARELEIHHHLSARRGSFLASDAHARELA